MAQPNIAKMKSVSSDHIKMVHKNKKKVDRKLEFKFYDPNTRKREVHKEVKK